MIDYLKVVTKRRFCFARCSETALLADEYPKLINGYENLRQSHAKEYPDTA